MFGQSAQKFDFKFSQNNTLFKLIYLNAAVFLGTIILYLPFWLMNAELNPKTWTSDYFAVPASLEQLIFRPWTIISYMFLHFDFWHLFINMLWLYFLGDLFVQFIGQKKLLSLYISGGIAGALLYIISFNLFPVFHSILPISKALGASASVMAIVVGLATYNPNFTIRLLFLGSIKLKYIAIGIFILDLASIPNANSGGHIAHIGGAIMGYFFARNWKKGLDITAWVDKSIDVLLALIPKKRPDLKVKYSKSRNDYEYNSNKKDQQEMVDAILDKISKSGYDSLSKAEKEFLFKAGKN